VDALDQLTIPDRRKVTELNLVLTELDAGNAARAVFTTKPYGIFAVSGPVAKTTPPSTSTYIAGIEVGANDKVVKELALLGWDTTERTVPEYDADALAATVARLEHGQVVEAIFEQEPYGPFTIVGVCVTSPVGNDKLVGTWFLTTGEAPSKRLMALTIVAETGEHTIPVPAAATRWAGQAETV